MGIDIPDVKFATQVLNGCAFEE